MVRDEKTPMTRDGERQSCTLVAIECNAITRGPKYQRACWTRVLVTVPTQSQNHQAELLPRVACLIVCLYVGWLRFAQEIRKRTVSKLSLKQKTYTRYVDSQMKFHGCALSSFRKRKCKVPGM